LDKTFFFLFLIVLACSFGLFVRQDLFAFDSYATWNAVRFGVFDTLGSQPLANLVWGLLPDSLLLFKLLMFCSLFLSIIPLYLVSEQFFGKKIGFYTIFVLLSASPILLFEFGKFENEIIAFPFIVWGLYFLFQRKWLKGLACHLCGLAFWFWPFYFVFNNFFFNTEIVEMQLFSGLINFWFLIPCIFTIFLFRDKRVLVFGLFGVFSVLWNAKFFLFLIFPLVFGIGVALSFLEQKKDWQNYLFITLFFCVFGWNVAFLLQSPTGSDWFFVDSAVKLSGDLNVPLYNDSSYGYWITHKGILTKYNPGTGSPIYVVLEKPFVVLTNQVLDCNLIVEEKVLGKKHKRLYVC